jgi:putative addiction module killer protein
MKLVLTTSRFPREAESLDVRRRFPDKRERSVGGGVSEMWIDCVPGYRVYLKIRGRTVVLLRGGDKSTQRKDIEAAVDLAKEV